MALQIEIKVINVGDADAIIVYLFDKERKFVILIDGGRKGHFDEVLASLSEVLRRAQKNAPDLIVCTHYDSDHICGAEAIIRHYVDEGTFTGKVWIHKPTDGLMKEVCHVLSIFEKKNTPSKIMLYEEHTTLDRFKEAGGTQLLLETYKDMLRLVDFMESEGIDWTQPFAGEGIPDFPEIKVVGPTRDYFDTLFPPNLKLGKALLMESRPAVGQAVNEAIAPTTGGVIDYCAELDRLPKARLTNTNLTSILIMITIEGNDFLFSGDAGEESFLTGAPSQIRNVYWLKIPHHGSRNNMSVRLLNQLAPKIAYISGNRLVSDALVGCLKSRGVVVWITRDQGTLNWPI